LSVGSLGMSGDSRTAMAQFKRIMGVIAVIAVLMVIGALTYLYIYSTLDTNTVVATTLGVFFATLLGCGLFAAAFFSDKSGHDQSVTDASKSERERH
jgi:apolipoprotein N-acyltransferase